MERYLCHQSVLTHKPLMIKNVILIRRRLQYAWTYHTQTFELVSSTVPVMSSQGFKY